jgi:hypothetical protein
MAYDAAHFKVQYQFISYLWAAMDDDPIRDLMLTQCLPRSNMLLEWLAQASSEKPPQATPIGEPHVDGVAAVDPHSLSVT